MVCQGIFQIFPFYKGFLLDFLRFGEVLASMAPVLAVTRTNMYLWRIGFLRATAKFAKIDSASRDAHERFAGSR